MADQFFEDIYEVVRLIPAGRATSYGAIAKYLGRNQGARIVGWAMNTCPDDVPAHRVVNQKGFLSASESFRGKMAMHELLESEGVKVINNQIVGWKSIFWDPSKELA